MVASSPERTSDRTLQLPGGHETTAEADDRQVRGQVFDEEEPATSDARMAHGQSIVDPHTLRWFECQVKLRLPTTDRAAKPTDART